MNNSCLGLNACKVKACGWSAQENRQHIMSMMWASREETPKSSQEQQETQQAQQTLFLLFITRYVFKSVQANSQPQSCTHNIYTGRYTNTTAVSDLIIFIYAHAAEYFLVKSYLFSDTHSGADHKQVLLEMLNTSMRNSVLLHTVFQTLQCNRSVQCFPIYQRHYMQDHTYARPPSNGLSLSHLVPQEPYEPCQQCTTANGYHNIVQQADYTSCIVFIVLLMLTGHTKRKSHQIIRHTQQNHRKETAVC